MNDQDKVVAISTKCTEHYDQVKKFMELARQDIPSSPQMPSFEVRQLRARLTLEEALEKIKGLGFEVTVRNTYEPVNMNEVVLLECGEPNLEEIIDGCCDLNVITTGTLIACGLPDVVFQNEVDKNNLAKFGPGHSIREDGKLIKPPGHKPPDIKSLLNALKG